MSSRNRGSRLLLVDDDALLRGMAAKTLQHAGFEVRAAADGAAALAQFAQEPFDLVLLDLVMPGLDGYEVCRRLRATEGGARLPILILTGLNDTESIELAYDRGATDFITKPINWTLLSHRVRYALRISAAADLTRRSQERLARAQSLAHMGHWAVHSDGRLECSAEQFRIYGALETEVLDIQAFARSAAQRVVAADRARVVEARRCIALEGTPYQMEFGVEHGDGSLRTFFEQATPIFDAQGLRRGFEGITQDITERVQAAQRIRELAHYDEVTGLPNRRLFTEIAGPALERARRSGTVCAVLHADIDRFSGVNDAYGRSHGDAVLNTLAQRMRSLIRSADLAAISSSPDEAGLLARFGDNAFTILIVDLGSQEQAALVAQRLLAAVAQPVVIDLPAGPQSLVLSASVGIALFPGDADDLPSLTRCAEQAAHAAKDAGRAQHRFFDEAINVRATERLLLEGELRLAIETGELRLYFQPKVDARNGSIVGAEALVRWQHPDRGLIMPDRFIGLAEDSGLIGPLTDWVLEAACQSLRRWSDAGLRAISLSVNLAASSLANARLPDQLELLMQRYGLSPASLLLELTETMVMRDLESVVVVLERLRARGFGLSLDDFGTGYSSLSHLKRLPIDELKIDRSFIADVALGRREGALAAAVITLGSELGLQVVAEGVETPEQSAFLLGRGCRLQQGYLFSMPVPGAAFEQLLRAGSTRRFEALALG
jgi:diguanylate cyclase (GGDEF)-like protein/PAS domain S-box-containing protein